MYWINENYHKTLGASLARLVTIVQTEYRIAGDLTCENSMKFFYDVRLPMRPY